MSENNRTFLLQRKGEWTIERKVAWETAQERGCKNKFEMDTELMNEWADE